MATDFEIAQQIKKDNEARRKSEEKPLKIDTAQLTGSKVAWMVGAFAIDAATAYGVWQITYWYYGVLWLVAGAGGLIYSDWLRERTGNNYDQKQIAKYGMNISWIMIAVMALLAGTVYVLGYTKVGWIEVTILVVTVSLFFYHVFQSYRFTILDDEYIARNQEARDEADHQKKLREIDRANEKVERTKTQANKREGYQKVHGAAFDAAYGLDVETPKLEEKQVFTPRQSPNE